MELSGDHSSQSVAANSGRSFAVACSLCSLRLRSYRGRGDSFNYTVDYIEGFRDCKDPQDRLGFANTDYLYLDIIKDGVQLQLLLILLYAHSSSLLEIRTTHTLNFPNPHFCTLSSSMRIPGI